MALKWLGILVALYLLVSIVPYLFERNFIFQGKSLSKEYKFEFAFSFTEHFIQLSDSTTHNALLFKTPFPSKGLIFYCHGNADNLVRWGSYTNDFLERGYDVFVYDYRGYGKSEGKPEKDLLLRDGKELWDWTLKHIPSKNRIIYGRSLGASIASHVAVAKNPTKLFLETPFDDIQNLMHYRFPFLMHFFTVKNNFSNVESLKKSREFPVHIFQGTKDRVVPLALPQNLKPYLTEKDSFTIIEGGKHKNLSSFDSFQAALDVYLGNRQ